MIPKVKMCGDSFDVSLYPRQRIASVSADVHAAKRLEKVRQLVNNRRCAGLRTVIDRAGLNVPGRGGAVGGMYTVGNCPELPIPFSGDSGN